MVIGLKMMFSISLCALLFMLHSVDSQNQHGADIEDNEFAEFEDFDEEVVDDVVETTPPPKQQNTEGKRQEGKAKKEEPHQQEEEDDEFADMDSDFQDEDVYDDDDTVIEVEDEGDFETFDPEEFEGLDGDDTIWENDHVGSKGKKGAKPELKIVDVPLHVRSWDKYYVEILMGFGLVVYIINFFMGKYMNSVIASGWFKIHKELLESQFELVGDDVQNKTAVSTLQFTKETEHIFTLWCSGRVCVEGMLVELRLLKRQDLVSIIASKMKPVKDKVMITINLEDMDPVVMAVGMKKSVTNLQKNMQDVVNYCVDKFRPAEKYDLPANMSIVSEIWGEVNNVLDAKVRKVIKENENFFEYLHISDQFSGVKPTDMDEPLTERPETSKKLILVLDMHCEGRNPLQTDIQKMLPLMKMALYLTDKLRRFRLSKEAKSKADKNRQKVELQFLKMTHSKRQEEAQTKKEEKEKAMKERIMNEEDPNKLRKLEDMQARKEERKRNKKLFKSKQMRASK